LEVFLEKIRAQGWFELFTNTHLGCSVTELTEFYVHYSIKKGVVMSRVGGEKIRFNAEQLGDILGVPSTGFDIYVREDKSVLGESRLLDLARRLSQETGLKTLCCSVPAVVLVASFQPSWIVPVPTVLRTYFLFLPSCLSL
jgi:hypothetical protein